MEIPIVLGFDAQYARPGFTTMQSVLDTADMGNLISFYILHDGLNPLIETVAGEMFNTDRSTVQFVNIRDFAPEFNPSVHGHVTAASFYRLLIPKIFQGFNRVIWLDSDLLAYEDLAPILTSHPADKPIAACRDYGEVFYDQYAPQIFKYRPSGSDHFNAGVLVYNLPAITKEDSDRLIALAPEKHTLHDQDILNKVFLGRVFYLSPRYNWGTLQIELANRLPPSLWEQIQRDAYPLAIRHYITKEKPWKAPHIPYAESYLKLYHKVSAAMNRLTLAAVYGT